MSDKNTEKLFIVQQFLRELFFSRLNCYFGGWWELYDFAVGEGDGAVGKGGQFCVVGDDDKSLSEFVAEAEEQAVEFRAGVSIKVAGGFVGKDDLRGVDEGAGDGDPLLFASGEFGGFVAGAGLESQEVKQGAGFALGFFAAVAFEPGRDAYIFEGGEFRQKMVELENEADVPVAESGEAVGRVEGDVFAVVPDFAAIGSVERAEEMQKGAFPRAAGTDDGDDFFFFDRQVDAFQDLKVAITFPDVSDFNHIQ